MSEYPEIAERFAKETAEHEMTVLHDDGLYRQVRFTAKGSLDWFDLIVWPFNLVVNGSHGSVHFCAAATEDMFALFRESRAGRDINPGYWAEKVRAGTVKSWSEDKFRAWVQQQVVELGARRACIVDAIWAQILDSDEHNLEYEETARYALANFEHDGVRLRFPEPWEHTFDDFDSHYLWLCHAVVWGIQRYDAAKAADKATAGGDL